MKKSKVIVTFLIVLLACCLCIILVACNNYNNNNNSNKENGELEYRLNSDDVSYSVTGKGTITTNDIVIPNIYQGKPVTNIDTSAFYECDKITSITIPNSVVCISVSAFQGCTSLTNINIPSSITKIDRYAFNGCSQLKNVYITDISAWCNIEFDSNYANPLIYAQNLYLNDELVTDLIIPNNVTLIKNYAFTGCVNISNITIPTSVINIGMNAFSKCRSLTIYCEAKSAPNSWNITWKDSTCQVVWNCSENEIATDGYIYKISNRIRYALKNGNAKVVQQSLKLSSSIDIPQSIYHNGTSYNVTEIIDSAFDECTKLTNVNIPNGITHIGEDAFEGCSNLTSITISDSVTSIGNSAFKNCSSLEYVNIGNGIANIGFNAFYACNKLKYNEFENSVYLGNSQNQYVVLVKVTTKEITDFIINDKTRIIMYEAFEDCCSLSNIAMPNKIVSIGSFAFNSCSSLVNIALPSSVTSIGSFAFSNCTKLTTITMTNSIDTINDCTFDTCTNLKTINFRGTKSEWRKISKYPTWHNNTGDYIIVCNDGIINKKGADI